MRRRVEFAVRSVLARQAVTSPAASGTGQAEHRRPGQRHLSVPGRRGGPACMPRLGRCHQRAEDVPRGTASRHMVVRPELGA